ncbi:MAG: site-specific DNA-methyltransferase [Alphaproteobacteria bacterium]|nr:site-specific DNA-methyltransferase [Alphaproteobacteria bacterium]MDA8004060.1 site-specific DNA-methyltransferase [Alphaproteobacteria bacterium]MDA8006122.1 site-specific DNA-methyltransferase [Alphaproteobacteria bacterium]MDA8013882.1 site-specific DNA-methyltransferase [Alphaproteobacteria bacterium]
MSIIRKHRIVCASAAAGREKNYLGRCALVVTSPPYHNAISYKTHVADKKANHRVRENSCYAREYHALLNKVWDVCHDLLMPGGVLCVNAGTMLENRYHYPLPQDIILNCLASRHSDWIFQRSILWHKVTAGVRRAGSVIQHRLPGYWYPNIMTEHIIVLQKKGARLRLRSGYPAEWNAHIWDFAPVPPGTVSHPAPFPEELPHRLIRMFTREGDVVVDPFIGSGTTARAAANLGRYILGFDTEMQYVRMARAAVEESSRIRRRQLRMVAVDKSKFVPGKSRGPTRHGAGLTASRPHAHA